jgi:hypothetical protein
MRTRKTIVIVDVKTSARSSFSDYSYVGVAIENNVLGQNLAGLDGFKVE